MITPPRIHSHGEGEIVAAVFVEQYIDLLVHIVEFLPKDELVNVATSSRALSRVTKQFRFRIKHLMFQGNAFKEAKSNREKTVADIQRFPTEAERSFPQSASLCEVIRPAFNLRRLDLIMCRVSLNDFQDAMRMVSGTLQDLRIEMICFREVPRRSQRLHPFLENIVGGQNQQNAPAAGGNAVIAAVGLVGQHVAGENGAGPANQNVPAPDAAGPAPVYAFPGQMLVINFNAAVVGEQPAPMMYPIPPAFLSEPEKPYSVEPPKEEIVMTALRRLDLSPPSSYAIMGLSFPKLMRLSSYRKMLEDKCSNCGMPRPSSKCGACKFYAFCTRECQMENWNHVTLGHKRVCHQNVEGDSPRSVSRLILEAAKSGSLRELDLAHYWHQNVLFDSAQGGPGSNQGVVNEDDDGEGGAGDGAALQLAPLFGGGDGLEMADGSQNQTHSAVFSRPVAIKVLEQLVSLRLLRCGVDDAALEVIAQNSPQLRALDISLNTKITDIGLGALVGLSGTLMDLRLRQDYRLTDEGIRKALVRLPILVKVDLRSGIRRLRPRNHPHPPNPQHNQNVRMVRITATTSTKTLLALDNACPHLKCIRIISVDDNGHVVTPIPESMQGRVEEDLRGGIDVDDFGEQDDFYIGEPL